MTTIAYHKGIIAYDSRSVAGDMITTDKCQKMTVVNGCRFWMSGSVCDNDRFVDLWVNGVNGQNINIAAIVLDNNNVLYFSGNDNDSGLWKEGIDINNCLCIGSGRDWATAAIDFGCTAKEAVKYAATRDVYTGGVIRSYKL